MSVSSMSDVSETETSKKGGAFADIAAKQMGGNSMAMITKTLVKV